MSRKRVLIVDDEPHYRRILSLLVEKMGHEAQAEPGGQAALDALAARRANLIVADLRMPGMDGLAFHARAREIDPDVPVIFLTAHGTVETAVTAMQQGAYHYLTKPFNLDELELIIARALSLGDRERESKYLREVGGRGGLAEMVGSSPAITALRERIKLVAESRSTTVLICGETGSGKELVARAIHQCSDRARGLFVPINCAAVPAELLESELFGHVKGAFTGASQERVGRFEAADGGTIFLDEIGDMSLTLQAKLLRVLEEGEVQRVGSNRRITVDVRVISATNRDLESMVAEKSFREDLFYRLDVVRLDVPPLRERKGDIRLLAEHFAKRYATEMGKGEIKLTPEAVSLLERHDWPGNIRELRNAIERAVVLARTGELGADLFLALGRKGTSRPSVQDGGPAGSLDDAVSELEKRMIERALHEAANNKAAAARFLGISERSLWYKLKKYGLS